MNAHQVFQYRINPRKKPVLPLNRVELPGLVSDPKPLDGEVQGMPATDIEERVARTLYKLQVPFSFQTSIPVMGSLPGRGKVIDFLLYTQLPQPLEVDGPRWHTTDGQKSEDVLREILLNVQFRRHGWLPLIRLNWMHLDTQVDADRAVRRIWTGGKMLGYE